MPKRSGSNKLRSSKRSSKGSNKGSSQPKSPASQRTPAPARADGSSSSDPKSAPSRSSDRDSSPPAAPARSPDKQSLLQRFNELPVTTRYAVIGAVVALVIGVAYFAFQSKQGSATAPKPAPTGEELAPPAPILVPPGILSALSSSQPRGHAHDAPAPPPAASPASSSAQVPAKLPATTPPGKTEPAAAQPPKPAPVDPPKPVKTAPAPPAPKHGGEDNPY